VAAIGAERHRGGKKAGAGARRKGSVIKSKAAASAATAAAATNASSANEDQPSIPPPAEKKKKEQGPWDSELDQWYVQHCTGAVLYDLYTLTAPHLLRISLRCRIISHCECSL